MQTQRYDRTAVLLHWLIAIALLAQIVFGFALDDLAPRNTPARAATINLHKSTGIVIGLFILVRLAWRMRHRPPAFPGTMAGWQQSAARAGHVALYACMLVQPLSGYIGSNFSKHGVKFFGTPLPPWGPDLPGVYALCNGIHIACAWVFVLLIAGHVLIAIKHAFDHDGVFARMWPSSAS